MEGIHVGRLVHVYVCAHTHTLIAVRKGRLSVPSTTTTTTTLDGVAGVGKRNLARIIQRSGRDVHLHSPGDSRLVDSNVVTRLLFAVTRLPGFIVSSVYSRRRRFRPPLG